MLQHLASLLSKKLLDTGRPLSCRAVLPAILTLVAFAYCMPSEASAYELKGWTIDNTGTVVSVASFEPYNGGVYFVGNSTDPQSGSFPTCGGGGTSSNLNPEAYVGLNVFSDGGLGTDPVGPVDCTVSGNYYLVFTESAPFTNAVYVYQLYYDAPSGIVTAGSGISNYDSYIIWKEPLFTTSSTTFDIDIEYLLVEGELQNGSEMNQILFNVCPLGYTSQQQSNCTKESLGSLTQNVVTTTTVTMSVESEGYSLGLVNFWNGQTDESCSWWQIFCAETRSVLGAGDSQTFNVATTTINADAEFIELLNANYDNFCGTLDVDVASRAICKVLLFLFTPSDNAKQTFLSLRGDLNTKMPFAPFAMVLERVTSLASTTPQAGSDLVLNVIGATTTVFSFTQTKIELDDYFYTDNVEEVFTYFYLLGFALYVWRRFVGAPSSENQV